MVLPEFLMERWTIVGPKKITSPALAGTSVARSAASGRPSCAATSSSEVSVYHVFPRQHVCVTVKPDRCEPRTYSMQPFAGVASTRGTQAVKICWLQRRGSQ